MPSPKSGKAGKAVPPATPDKAEDADIADPGKVAEIKAEQNQTKSGKYGSQKVKPFKPMQAEQAAAGKQGAEEGKKEEQIKPSWIEIELVDELEEPVTGEAYEIELPDGSVASGTTDDKGFARVEGFEAGTCKITYPKLDQEAWEPH